MPKNSKETIEGDNEKVIKLLINDSRQSPNEIAKKLGFSRQKVWRIIKKLEKDKVIWGYSAIISGESLNMNTYLAIHRVKGPFSEVIDKIIKRAKEKEVSKLDIKVIETYYLNGTYDWITIFSAKNIKDAKIFVGYMQKEYGEYIERIDLLECVFPLVKCHKVNPKIQELRKFALS
jgi:DNA-binding Lrp family transcriptional regulator